MMGSTFEDDEAALGFPASFPARSFEAEARIHAPYSGRIDVRVEPLSRPTLPGKAHRFMNQSAGATPTLVAKHGAANAGLTVLAVEHPSPSKDRIALVRQENQLLARPDEQRQSRFCRALTGAVVTQVER